MKPNTLTMVVRGTPESPRFLIEAGGHYWSGDDWVIEDDARLFYNEHDVGGAIREILLKEVQGKPTRRFTFRCEIQIFGDTPIDLDDVRLWLSEALKLSVDYKKDIGEGNVALATVDLADVKEESEASPMSDKTPLVELEEARQQLKSGDFTRVIDTLSSPTIFASTPKHAADCLFLRAKAYHRKGDSSQAIADKLDLYSKANADYTEALERYPPFLLDDSGTPTWRPETTWALPSYVFALKRFAGLVSPEWLVQRRGHRLVLQVARSLRTIGRAAAQALPALDLSLESLASLASLANHDHDQVLLSFCNGTADGIRRTISCLKLPPDGEAARRQEDEHVRTLTETLDTYRNPGWVDPQSGPVDPTPLLRLSIDELHGRLRSTHAEEQAAAICALRILKGATLETFVPMMRHGQSIVRAMAALAAGDLVSPNDSLSTEAGTALARLVEMLRKDRSYHARNAAATAIGMIARANTAVASQSNALVDALVENMSRDGRRKALLVEALGCFGSKAQRAVNVIESFEPERFEQTADVIKAEALLRIGPPNGDVCEDCFRRLAAASRGGQMWETNVPCRALEAMANVPIDKERCVAVLIERRCMDFRYAVRHKAQATLQLLDYNTERKLDEWTAATKSELQPA